MTGHAAARCYEVTIIYRQGMTIHRDNMRCFHRLHDATRYLRDFIRPSYDRTIMDYSINEIDEPQ